MYFSHKYLHVVFAIASGVFFEEALAPRTGPEYSDAGVGIGMLIGPSERWVGGKDSFN